MWIYRKKGDKYYVSSDFIAKNTFNIRWFGVSGKGNSDDSSAIQKAIDLANSYGVRAILFPAGRYKINSTVILRSRVNLIGTAHASSVFFTSDEDIKYFSWTGLTENIVIENISFTNTGIGKGEAISADHFSYLSYLNVRDCLFWGNLKECIKGDLIFANIDRCVFGYYGNTGAMHRHLNLTGRLSNTSLNFNTVSNCAFFYAKGEESVRVASGQRMTFVRCDWELNQTTYKVSVLGVFGVTFDYCWFEAHPNSYLIRIANNPEEPSGEVMGSYNLTLKNSHIYLNSNNISIFRIMQGQGVATSINIYGNVGKGFNNNNPIVTGDLPNDKIASYYNNHFNTTGNNLYTGFANTIRGVDLVRKVCPQRDSQNQHGLKNGVHLIHRDGIKPPYQIGAWLLRKRVGWGIL